MPTITITLTLQVDAAADEKLSSLAAEASMRCEWITGNEFGNPNRDSYCTNWTNWAEGLAGYEGPYVNRISADEKVEGLNPWQ